MTDLLAALGRHALPLSAQVGLLVALAWATVSLLGDRLADLRYRLWLVVLARLLVPAVVVIPIGWLAVEAPAPLRSALALASAGAADTETAADGASGTPSSSAPTTPSRRVSAPVLVALVWLTGAAALALASLLRHRRLRREIDLARPATGPLAELVERQRRALAIAAPVSVRVLRPGASLAGPALVGLLRPHIVVPDRLAEGWQEEVHGPLLVHELVHLQRRDGWVNLAVTVVRAVYFFHPLVWLATARLLRERERVCDDAVVRIYGSTGPYVQALCEHALTVGSLRRGGAGVSLARSRSELVHRIQRLERRGYDGRRIPALPAVLLGAALVLIASAGPSGARRTDVDGALPADLSPLYRELDEAMSRPGGAADAAAVALRLTEEHPRMPSEFALMAALALVESELAPRGREAWLSHLRSRRDDPVLLRNAAHFFELQDAELAQALLARGDELEPGEWWWRGRLGTLRLRQAYREPPARAQGTLEAARRDLGAALERAPEGTDRVQLLGRAARAALATGRLVEADALAERQLAAAGQTVTSWNYGNALHQARLTRGEVALRRGDTAAAAEWLVAAGDLPGSPQLDTFGPNMALAEELLRRGERAPVLTYLERCGRFWRRDRGRLARWSGEIRAGRIPDFGANKTYQLQM